MEDYNAPLERNPWKIWVNEPKTKKGGNMKKEVLKTQIYEYRWPFEYPNVTRRSTFWNEKHGIELDPPEGHITIEEEEPIIAVSVVGSACSPPGWVMVEADPIPGTEDAIPHPPLRQRATNLWGMHMRYDLYTAIEGAGEDPGKFWMTGLSTAHFEFPKCRRVHITAGSELPATPRDNYPDDLHYSVRFIRVTVVVE
jgi:hypothetical protein